MSYILHDLNIGHNDVIALSAENRLEFAIVLFAAFAVNATVAPLNVTYSKGKNKNKKKKEENQMNKWMYFDLCRWNRTCD